MFRIALRIACLLVVAAGLAASPASAGSSRAVGKAAAAPLLQAYPGG